MVVFKSLEVFLVAVLVSTTALGGGRTAVEGIADPPPAHRSLSVGLQQLEYDFYRDECPQAERVVWTEMRNILSKNGGNATAQLLRLLFHDCFIGGCEASVMLLGSNQSNDRPLERQAIPNKTLKGFNFIESIKEKLENECPGIVSCSDVLAVATRDGIAQSGGPYYPVLTGRRDSVASYFDKAMADIPRPDGNISETLRLFSLRGFDEKETVALLGGHHIGKISCEFIEPRLSNFKGTGMPDPSIPPEFLLDLRNNCQDSRGAIKNDSPFARFRSLIESSNAMAYSHGLSSSGALSNGGFDNHYYRSLSQGKGLLFADQQLMANPRTRKVVLNYASDDGTTFRFDFARVMIKLSNLGVLTGSEGEVRLNCSNTNNAR